MLRIHGARVFDPAHDVRGEVRDVWLDGGRIVAPPSDPDVAARAKTFRAEGCVVMPGGIDMHCHLVGPKVNAGRRLAPELLREARPLPRTERTFSGLAGPAPTSFATGYLFSALGYTTAMDAAQAPLHARAAHEDFHELPLLDKGFYLLSGNNHYVLDCLRDGDEERLDAYLAWSLAASKAFAVKIVNPGGIENWKQISRKTLRELDEPTPRWGVSPRRIVEGLAAAVDRLGLPHAAHVHCNNLGVPGNWETTLRTMEALDGRRGHFAHIQFHSYAGDAADPRSFASAVPRMVEFFKARPNLTLDVGHVHPGRTLSMTADAPFSHALRRLTGAKWFAADTEMESSCGVIPVEYRPEKSWIHAVQWAIALEWYLLMKDDPWRIALTSDHPNGGAFYHYPEMIRLLMDRSFRQAAIARMPTKLREKTVVAELDQEYSLHEIAIITRAAPARMLGLATKGHLGVGAEGDVTVYVEQADRAAMFASPRWVFKGGELVVENGEIVAPLAAETLFVAPEFDSGRLGPIRSWFQEHYSVSFGNYAVPEEFLAGPRRAG